MCSGAYRGRHRCDYGNPARELVLLKPGAVRQDAAGGRPASRAAVRAGHEGRIGDQSQVREGHGADDPAVAAGESGSAHRMNRRTFLCVLALWTTSGLMAELPLERPIRYEFVINMKTAR